MSFALGTIEAPFDHDADPDTPDVQDVDVVKFTSTGGQLVRFTVQPLPGAMPMAAVLVAADPESSYAFQTNSYSFGGARYAFLAEAGDYYLQVVPKNVLQSGAPVGSAEDEYALTIEEVALPTPEAAGTGFTGGFMDLTDNFFVLDQNSSGDLAQLSFDVLGGGVSNDIYVHYMTGDGAGNYTYLTTVSTEAGEDASVLFPLPGDDVAVLLDYQSLFSRDDAFEVSIGAPTNLEALGAIAADTLVTAADVTLNDNDHFFTFTIEPNQVVEIRQDTTATALVDVFGPNGVVFEGKLIDGYTGSFIGDPYAAYFYSPNGGNYTVRVEDETSSLTGVAFTIGSATPGASTTLALGGTDQKTSATALDEFRREYFTYELSDNSLLTLDALNAGGGLTDVFVFDATTGEEVFAGDAFFDSSYEGEDTVEIPLMAGTYLVGVGAEGAEDLGSGYTLDVTAAAPPAFELEPNDDAGTATPVNFTTQYALGAIEAGNADFFTFQVPADLAAGETLALSVRPDAAFIAQDTYTCRVSDSAGLVAEQVGISTDCLLWLTGLTAAETYTVEYSTTATGPIDYRMDTTLIDDGALESEPNDDYTTNATDTGSLPALGLPSVVYYGELTTDGLTSDVDAFQIKLDANLDPGQAISISAEDVFNVSPTGSVTLELIDPNDPLTPLATASAPNLSLSVTGLTAGVYYLVGTRADTDVTTTGRYRVAIASASLVTETEPNDDSNTATPVGSLPTRLIGSTGSCRVTATSTTCAGSDVNGQAYTDPDYFTFTPAVTGTYGFDTATSTFCGSMELFDTDGTTSLAVDEEGDTVNGRLVLNETLNAGQTYYLYLGGWCGSTGASYDYDVTVTAP